VTVGDELRRNGFIRTGSGSCRTRRHGKLCNGVESQVKASERW